MKILIFGKGFIGSRCSVEWADEAVLSDLRVSDIAGVLAEIDRVKPDVVLNAAGTTGKPNVDWCDAHPRETVFGNTYVPICIAEACAKRSVYMLHLGSGCIFYGASPHPDGMWREEDFGNPKPTYSRAKWAADLVLSTLPNVGIARLRMPIDHAPGSRNLIDKLAKYPKIIDVRNSVTVVDDLVSVLHQLLEKRGTGIFHVTNPGVMAHRDLMALYVELVDPKHTNEWIKEEDLVAQGLATKARSNNVMTSTRLEALDIHMRPVQEALRDTMTKYAVAVRAKKPATV